MSFTNFANAFGTTIQRFYNTASTAPWGRKSYLMRIEILEEPGTGQFLIVNSLGTVLQLDTNVATTGEMQKVRDFLRTGKV